MDTLIIGESVIEKLQKLNYQGLLPYTKELGGKLMKDEEIKAMSQAICFTIGYYADRDALEWLEEFYGCTFDCDYMLDHGAMSVGAALGERMEFLKFLDEEKDVICPDFILDRFGGRDPPSQFISRGRLHHPYTKVPVEKNTTITKEMREYLNKMADGFKSIREEFIEDHTDEEGMLPVVWFEGRELFLLIDERWYNRYHGWHYID